MVDSCGTCEYCQADREQNCSEGATFNSPDPISGGHTYDGYSDKVVVSERLVVRIPPGADLAATAPLLCAGITTFSPMSTGSLVQDNVWESSASAAWHCRDPGSRGSLCRPQH
jgi:D-arabinose 1-dehydrogenase-like Zn-dependent alcohol dehydrogenase